MTYYTMSDNISFKKHNFDMRVEEVEYVKYVKSEALGASWLTLKFSGKDFSVKMANSIRRAAANRIPTYATPLELINIETNTTVAFNNDYMRLQLSTVPIIGIDPDLYYLDEKYWYKVNFADTAREKHKNEQSNEFYVQATNETSNITAITTNDMIIHINGDQQKLYSEQYPILLIKARPKDSFKCHMKSVLGIGDMHAIWKAARSGYYDEIETTNGKEYLLTLEGNWQFTEYDLYIRTCKYLIHKLQKIKEDIQQKMESKEIIPEQIIYFVIPNEDHTIGEILNYEFQNHGDILGSGLTKPDHLIKSIMFKVQSVADFEHPIDAMLECIDICINKFSHVGKLIEDISKNQEESKDDEKKPKKTKK
jgi:DNA-directed RNA polymerase subunit L